MRTSKIQNANHWAPTWPTRSGEGFIPRVLTEILATNVVASRPPELRPNATPTACDKNIKHKEIA